jgi:hypothetical protein
MSTTLHRIADNVAAEVYAQLEEVSPDTEAIFADLDDFDQAAAHAVAQDLAATIGAAVQQRVADWYADRADRTFAELAADLVTGALLDVMIADRAERPEAWAGAETFADLHDRFDANELVDAAFDHVGIDPDYTDQRWLDVANAATDHADQMVRAWAGVR